jgi:hypothetical protein
MSSSKLLTDIQKLQFTNRHLAERELLAFLKEHEDSSITKVELNPKPESLNSINGFLTYADNKRCFFKSHTEENEKLPEYYNAEALAQSGYPVLAPKQINRRPGKQIALYEIISLPTLFDLAKQEEDSLFSTGALSEFAQMLIAAQVELDKKTFEIYEETLEATSCDEHSRAPIHQLFSHRLAEDGRFGLFYRDRRLAQLLSFEDLSKKKWIINGVEYFQTLHDLVVLSRASLTPKGGPTIIGHGDAHNGNVFVDSTHRKLYLFDPAFAGRHHPLLDITKPLFHNVFARWMYFPEQVLGEFDLNYRIDDKQITIEHSFRPSALRMAFLKAKVENVVRPTIDLLQSHKLLDSEWQTYLRCALFCCPLLTVNLCAESVPDGPLAERYELPVKLLGLSIAVEVASGQHKGISDARDLIDQIFQG